MQGRGEVNFSPILNFNCVCTCVLNEIKTMPEKLRSLKEEKIEKNDFRNFLIIYTILMLREVESLEWWGRSRL